MHWCWAHGYGLVTPRPIVHAADFDMWRSLIARVDRINAIDSDAIWIAQSMNGTCISAAEHGSRAVELPASVEADLNRPWFKLCAAWCCNNGGE